MKKLFGLFVMVALLAACSETTRVEGRWVEPVPGMEGQEQGFVLEKGGVASSINMQTLQYSAWKCVGDSLSLTGKSIGNGRSIDFTERFKILKLTHDSLVLQRGQVDWVLTRNLK